MAARAASDYSAQRLSDAFEQSDDGMLSPKSSLYNLGGSAPIEIADYTLVRPGGLDLKTLDVEFEVEVDFGSVADGSNASPENLASLTIKPKRGLLQRNSHVKVKATFEMGSRPEAAEVVSDKLVENVRNQISGGN